MAATLPSNSKLHLALRVFQIVAATAATWNNRPEMTLALGINPEYLTTLSGMSTVSKFWDSYVSSRVTNRDWPGSDDARRVKRVDVNEHMGVYKLCLLSCTIMALFKCSTGLLSRQHGKIRTIWRSVF